MKRLFLSLALALAFAASAFGGDAYYRVFYYVRGEHRERPVQAHDAGKFGRGMPPPGAGAGAEGLQVRNQPP